MKTLILVKRLRLRYILVRLPCLLSTFPPHKQFYTAARQPFPKKYFSRKKQPIRSRLLLAHAPENPNLGIPLFLCFSFIPYTSAKNTDTYLTYLPNINRRFAPESIFFNNNI